MKKFLTSIIALLGFAAAVNADSYVAGNQNPAWLGSISDETPVANLLIPGAHDAATGEGFAGIYAAIGDATAKCQVKKIRELWACGVRAFDIRPAMDSGQMTLHHGIMPINMTVKEFFDTLDELLSETETEFVILHVLRQSGSGATYYNAWNTSIASCADRMMPFRRNLTVGDMRGKILMISRGDYFPDYNVAYDNVVSGWNETNLEQYRIQGKNYNWGSLYIQDLAQTETTAKLNQKKDLLGQLFQLTKEKPGKRASQSIWVVNFATAYNNDGTANSQGYKEVATEMNAQISSLLDDCNGVSRVRAMLGSKAMPAGIVMMDYIGDPTADANSAFKKIIATNFDSDAVTGVEDIDIEAADAFAEPTGYYDLSGRRVENPAPGQVIIVKYANGKAEKVIF